MRYAVANAPYVSFQKSNSNPIDRAYALTTGNDGAIYVSGVTSGNLDGQTNIANFGASFISKYNADGTWCYH